MDDSALQGRLHRIERQQRLILVLLVVPYLLGVAELVGYWTAGALYAAVGIVAAAVVVFRRRSGSATGQ